MTYPPAVCSKWVTLRIGLNRRWNRISGSRVLSYAVELGKIASNPCEGIKKLHSGGDRADRI